MSAPLRTILGRSAGSEYGGDHQSLSLDGHLWDRRTVDHRLVQDVNWEVGPPHKTLQAGPCNPTASENGSAHRLHVRSDEPVAHYRLM